MTGSQSFSSQKARSRRIPYNPNFDPATLSDASELDEANNLHRRLKPFEEDDACFFIARQGLIERLYARIASLEHSLTVVLSVSGFGKSSLVKAGLENLEDFISCWE
jgi:hypothetical protein